MFYYTQIPRLSWPGQCSNFIFNFSGSYGFVTVFCALAPQNVNCFICKIFSAKWPQICIQTLHICLIIILSNDDMFLSRHKVCSPKRSPTGSINNHWLCLSGIASKFNWVLFSQIFFCAITISA